MTLSYPEVMKTGADGAHDTEFWRPVRQAPRIYVILRVAPPPEGSGPGSEDLRTRSFTSFRTTEQGPSRCSGRQSTRARYRDYVILRSGFATKNLTLVLNPGHSFVQDDRARSFALLRTTGTRFSPDGKDPTIAFPPHPA